MAFMRVQLIYNVALVSAVQQGLSLSLSRATLHAGPHRGQRYDTVRLCQSPSARFPLLLPSTVPPGNHEFVFCICSSIPVCKQFICTIF